MIDKPNPDCKECGGYGFLLTWNKKLIIIDCKSCKEKEVVK